MKAGKNSTILKKWLRRLNGEAKAMAIDEGYTYKKGRVKTTRADFVAYAAKCQANIMIVAGEFRGYFTTFRADGTR